jgi:hypothetical protein
MAKKIGRPCKEIDEEQFEKLCSFFCSKLEIASFFDISDDTLDRWCKKTYGEGFAVVWDKKSSKGRISLRRKQIEVAMSGNVTMLIWAGKQYLGQRDKEDIDLTGKEIKIIIDKDDEKL